MRIALAQVNPVVGDLTGNAAKVADFARRAAAGGARLAVFPELVLNGYPPRDLIEKPSFLARTADALEQLAAETADLPLAIIVGYVGRCAAQSGKTATNSAAVLEGGRIVFRQDKMLLPTYDVFDETRYFRPAEKQETVVIGGVPVALTICEDAWNDKQFWDRPLYRRDPVEELVQAGARLVVSINGSPYHRGKRALRREIFASMTRRLGLPAVYVNQAGGNDELVFDGSSFAMDASGEVVAAAASFAEDLIFTDLAGGDRRENFPDECEAVYEALVLGTRDYLRKCGFSQVLLGLSGGIDSSITAAIAVDAVGRGNVTGIAMPGPYSSEHSVADARALAENLGIRFEVVPITGAYDRVIEALRPLGVGDRLSVAEENIQSRLRGLTLMTLSNKWGAMVLTTGNKSELAVGYCTLYGDMCGGLAVISDVPKTLVYEISRVANRRHGNAIPESVFTKPPSAELRPDQRDTDSLPPYDILDPMLEAYVEDLKTPAEIAARLGLDVAYVRSVLNMVDRNEYKRQQAAPGLKVTTKAFGSGRRYPIAQRYTE
jgi:NAD+ synthase/NAD+ synthase (glutamine-hydrolysing)